MANKHVGEQLTRWLADRVVARARGADEDSLDVEPSGKFWLGRLAPEAAVLSRGLGERGERLEPCAVGLRFKIPAQEPYTFSVSAALRVWQRDESKIWRKSPPIGTDLTVTLSETAAQQELGWDQLAAALAEYGSPDTFGACVHVEVGDPQNGEKEVAVQLINKSREAKGAWEDTNLYETVVTVGNIDILPFELEALPDSFRYDRDVVAYGINSAVIQTGQSSLATTDALAVDRYRPEYWNARDDIPTLRFEDLEEDPAAELSQLLRSVEEWGKENWGAQAIQWRARQESWTEKMESQARAAATDFWEEVERFRDGIEALQGDSNLEYAFRLMNRAVKFMAAGKYDRWRPFQVGFLLTVLPAVKNPGQASDVADIVWFATGGGKTETYLGLIITAALFDRTTGKSSGVTAWSRFPLRMLSLQQTQRFADALGAAEAVRREASIGGAPISLGFFVGGQATPNSIKAEPKDGEPDPDDPDLPERYRILMTCPFCGLESLRMRFNRRRWTLEHQCTNETCTWPHKALPFYIVDDEVYRFLPTVVVGTLDKAAGIGFQASMRGLVGPPWGRCSIDGHGYTYAPRSSRPHGCLVPDCEAESDALGMQGPRFGPSFRLQDELHLLKDSLGAVDAHYESLLDDLQETLCGYKPKIVGSSATLSGYADQVAVLYSRGARAFPVQGPTASDGFWSQESSELMRRYVALAPRGVTLEYTIDRILTESQRAIRELEADPERVCDEIGIHSSYADTLVSLYGTNVVYGNTIRDLDAVQRSLETQVQVDGELNTASLTGRTSFDEVRHTLSRLRNPEPDFQQRIHAITASSMMSHGVDIDRLNVMAVLGLPLTTAEFVQATARVGRQFPGLIWVTHKIGRERDASVFRAFRQFIEQGDRFVESVPVTRRSRRVMQRTLPGLEIARIHCLHEFNAQSALTTVKKLREFVGNAGISAETEYESLVRALDMDQALDEQMRTDLREWLDRFFDNLDDPTTEARFPSELCPHGGPMRSLRDVEEQVPVYGSLT